MPVYCMFKGLLKYAAPYEDAYGATPHYVITVDGGDQEGFNIVVNSASQIPEKGDRRVYAYLDPHFDDPIIPKLDGFDLGLYTSGFPRLDYFQDTSLLDLKRFRLIPDVDEDGSRYDINDDINSMLTIDESGPSVLLPYNNEGDRKFWKPTDAEVVVYGFGFLFEPEQNGLHETHMNQGNPKIGGHGSSNGSFQDGAVIVQKGEDFEAIFTAFQSQELPTLANGQPAQNAVPFAQFIGQG